MQDWKANLDRLEQRVMVLVQEYELSRQEVSLLKAENAELRDLLKRQDEKLQTLSSQAKVGSIASTVAQGGQGSRELKDKINEYIREIDRVIAHLRGDVSDTN